MCCSSVFESLKLSALTFQVSASSTQLKIVYANINMNKTTLILQDTITVKNTNYFVSHLDGIDLAVQVFT